MRDTPTLDLSPETGAEVIPPTAPIRLIWSPAAAAWEAMSKRLGLFVAAGGITSLFGIWVMLPAPGSHTMIVFSVMGTVSGIILLPLIALLLIGIAVEGWRLGGVPEGIGSVFARIAGFFMTVSWLAWAPLGALARRLPVFRPAAEALVGWLMPAEEDTDQATLARFPSARFPELYAPVPTDLALPLVADGCLPGGQDTAWLARRGVSRELVVRATERALGLAAIALVASLVAALVYGVATAWVSSGMPTPHPIEIMPGYYQSSPFGASPRGAGGSGPEAAGTLFLIIGIATLIFASLTRAGVKAAVEKAGARYLMPTKDSYVRYPYRIDQHQLVAATLRRQIEQANTRLLDTPVIKVGTASGLLRQAGSLLTPAPGTPLTIDGESLFQHMLILGSTGEGKTSAYLRPLARQILGIAHPKFGMLTMDAKGTLWRDIAAAARAAGREDDVLVVGIEPGDWAINLVAALDPPALAYLVRDMFRQAGGGDGGNSSFFRDTAATVIRHAATLAAHIEAYDLRSIYRLAVEPAAFDVALAMLGGDEMPADHPAAGAVSYFRNQWLPLVHETRDGVVATLATVLDPVVTDPRFSAFCAPRPGDRVKQVNEALEGKIVCVSISATETGIAGRLALMAIKSSLFRAARIREAARGSEYAQAHPCVIMIDEAQEIVASSTSGLSDSSFFNVARSAGVAGIYATQALAALHLAIGREATDNLRIQFRSRVFLRSEDPETIKEMTEIAGSHMRSHVYEAGHYESVESWEARTGIRYLQPLETDQAAAIAAIDQQGSGYLASLALNRGAATDPGHKTGFLYQPYTVPWGGPLADGPGWQFVYQETVRIQDLNRRWLNDGHSERPALSGEEVATWGRFHALVYVQRAGGVRLDIAAVEHDFN